MVMRFIKYVDKLFRYRETPVELPSANNPIMPLVLFLHGGGEKTAVLVYDLYECLRETFQLDKREAEGAIVVFYRA